MNVNSCHLFGPYATNTNRAMINLARSREIVCETKNNGRRLYNGRGTKGRRGGTGRGRVENWLEMFSSLTWNRFG